MRKINWEDKLSDEDIAWLRTTGAPGMEERIVRHQEQFEAEVPEVEIPEDKVTRSALDPTAGADSLANQQNGPLLVDPTKESSSADKEDDYDTWTKAELEEEVTARNSLSDTSDVEVVGTGKNGAVLVADLIKGLRLWDQENPGALA